MRLHPFRRRSAASPTAVCKSRSSCSDVPLLLVLLAVAARSTSCRWTLAGCDSFMELCGCAAVNLAPPVHGRDSACFGVHQEQGSVRELTCIIAHFGCSVQPRARSRANCQTPAWLSCRVAEPMACAWAKLTPVLEGTPTVLWTTSNSSGSASRRRPRRAGLARGRRRGCFCGATSFCAGEIPAQICRFSQVGRSQHAKAMHHAGGKSY